MATPYTYKSLIQRIKRHIANGFPNSSFSISDNEMSLYIDQAVAFTLVGQVFNNAKLEGSIAVPDAYLTTYSLPALQRDNATREFWTTLPQPPVSLPLGYSMDQAYFADSVNGKGYNVSLIKAKRVGYRSNMPSHSKPRGWVEGSKMIVVMPDGSSLAGLTLYVRMATTRTGDVTDEMTIPADAMEQVWKIVTDKILQRMQLPKDVVADDLPTGNTNLK